MKRIFLLIITFLSTVASISAQRYLPGMRGLQVTAGTVNGLNPQSSFHSGIALSTYTKSGNRRVLGFEYLEKRYPYKDLNIPQSQFTVDAGYYLKCLSDRRRTFTASLGLSAVAGYETVNWDTRQLPDGATINNADGFLYGGAITLETEIYLTDRIVLLTNVRERLLGGSSVGKLNTQFGMGIKFIIN